MFTVDWFALPSVFCLSFLQKALKVSWITPAGFSLLLSKSPRRQTYQFTSTVIFYFVIILISSSFLFQNNRFLSYSVFLQSRFCVIVFYWVTLTFSSISTSFWMPTYLSCTTTMFSHQVWVMSCHGWLAVWHSLCYCWYPLNDFRHFSLSCLLHVCMHLLFKLPCFPFSVFLI